MKMKILINGPVLSRSGYGEMARFAYRSFKTKSDIFDIYLTPTNWGNTGTINDLSEETRELYEVIVKTQKYILSTQQAGSQPNFDLCLQISIPNEWKRMAPINIGYTAGIETTAISPAWLQPSNEMDKIITISHHSKKSFVNTIFSDDKGNQYKVNRPIDVCHFPVRKFKEVNLDLNLKYDFNFLAVCQWGARKNLEQTIIAFLEEFQNDEVGLVLKINTINDSYIDKEMTEERLKNLLNNYKNRKCSVHLLHGHLEESEMQALYKHSKIKAFVSTSHGEGFGLPFFEAAYNELPVIATDWSGHLDFLTIKDEDEAEKKLFAKVDYELKPIAQEHVWQGVLEAGTAWAFPVHTNLKSKMREVYKDYPRFKSWAKKLSTYIHNEFTEDKIYSSFLNSCIGEKKIQWCKKQMEATVYE